MPNLQNPFEEIINRLNEIDNKISQISQPQTKTVKPGFITRNDVCERLHITLPTVHSWIKKGVLKPYHIGGRTLFREDEVMKAAKPVDYNIK